MQQHSRPRILVISHDVVGRRMAGPGIRAWQIARVLAAHGQVTLVAPWPIDLAADFALGHYAWGQPASLAPWLAAADLVVANGFLLEAHPELAELAQPLALDLYDPVLLENLELLRDAPPERRAERNAADQRLLARALAAGDFFLCATERQRDLYLGALMLAGRLAPDLVDADPLARGLIDVAPFGLDPTPPARQGPALRGGLPGIGPSDPLLLWTGGLWDWLDPLTLIDALPALLARHPSARLVLLAGRHPGAAGAMRMPELARARAAERGLLGTHVLFYDEWVPYERRADFLLDATVAVSLHRDHLETAYAAVRSRFLDHLWAGLPSLVSDGDAAAELVRAHGLGRVAAIGDAADVARQLDALLSDPAALAACAASARALAQEYTWERTLAPLVRWVRSAKPAPARRRQEVTMTEPAAPPAPEPAAPDLAALAELIAQAERLWQLGRPGAPSASPRALLAEAVRQAAAPAYAQQTELNAVLVRALYWMISEAQRGETRAGGLQHQIWALERELNELRIRLGGVFSELNERLLEDERSATVLAEAIAELQIG